jgi:hypothetical protein
VQYHKNPTALRAISKAVDSFGPVPSIRYAISGEVIFGCMALDQVSSLAELSEQMTGVGANELMPADPLTASAKQVYEADIVSRYCKVFADVPADPSDWPAMKRAAEEVDRNVSADKTSAALALLLMPSFTKIGADEVKLVVLRRIDQTAIRLFETAASASKLPANLPDWGQVTRDPFSGRSLKYKADRGGFLLYSVGSGGADKLASAISYLPKHSTNDILVDFRSEPM